MVGDGNHQFCLFRPQDGEIDRDDKDESICHDGG